eukprot:4735988-Alexandrium_andersonii.AAC.1
MAVGHLYSATRASDDTPAGIACCVQAGPRSGRPWTAVAAGTRGESCSVPPSPLPFCELGTVLVRAVRPHARAHAH